MARLENIEKKSVVFNWVNTPKEERNPKTQTLLAKELGVSGMTVCAWVKEAKGIGAYNSQAYLEGRKAEVDRALVEACLRKNSQALRTFYQRMGLLTEKTEVDIGIISADERARRLSRAHRELREGGYRVVEVPGEPDILSEDIRED